MGSLIQGLMRSVQAANALNKEDEAPKKPSLAKDKTFWEKHAFDKLIKYNSDLADEFVMGEHDDLKKFLQQKGELEDFLDWAKGGK